MHVKQSTKIHKVKLTLIEGEIDNLTIIIGMFIFTSVMDRTAK